MSLHLPSLPSAASIKDKMNESNAILTTELGDFSTVASTPYTHTAAATE